MDSSLAIPAPLLALFLLPGAVQAWWFWHGYPGDLFAFNNQLVVRDYINLWAGGRLAAEGRTELVFQPHGYFAWLRSVFGERLDPHVWGYPPHLLLLAVPLAWLPLVPGFLAWVAATGAVMWAALRAAGMARSHALAAALSPAALESALTGQNGTLISGAGLAGGLLLSGRRPVLAGALLGLLSLKPQIGLLVPVCLCAARAWSVLGWAAAFAAAYCAAGLAAFGWAPWVDYATVTAPFMRRFIEGPFGLVAHYMMVPPFITLRAAGADLATAYTGQAAATLACAVMVWRAWSLRAADNRAAIAFTLCLAPLATPYAHSYDLVCVAVACAVLARLAQEQGESRPAERLCLGLAWLWPTAAFSIGGAVCPGLSVFVLLPLAALAWQRLTAADSRRPAPSDGGRNLSAAGHVNSPHPPSAC